jgi:hypothetical protein
LPPVRAGCAARPSRAANGRRRRPPFRLTRVDFRKYLAFSF